MLAVSDAPKPGEATRLAKAITREDPSVPDAAALSRKLGTGQLESRAEAKQWEELCRVLEGDIRKFVVETEKYPDIVKTDSINYCLVAGSPRLKKLHRMMMYNHYKAKRTGEVSGRVRFILDGIDQWTGAFEGLLCSWCHVSAMTRFPVKRIKRKVAGARNEMTAKERAAKKCKSIRNYCVTKLG